MTGLIWPADWAPMTTPLITGPGPLASGGTMQVGAFEWTPTTVGHECLLMIVEHAGRPQRRRRRRRHGLGLDPALAARSARQQHRAANVAPVSGMNRASLIESLGERWFEIVNPSKRKKAVVFVELKLPPLLVKLGWHVKLKGVKAERFTLAPGQKVKVQLVGRPRRADLAEADSRAEEAAADRRDGLDRRRGRRRHDVPDRPEVEVTGNVPGPGRSPLSMRNSTPSPNAPPTIVDP